MAENQASAFTKALEKQKALKEQEIANRRKIESAIRQAEVLNVEGLVQNKRLGDAMDLSEASEYFDAILTLWRQVGDVALDSPLGGIGVAFNRLATLAEDFTNLVEKVQEFEPHQDDAKITRLTIINMAHGHCGSLFAHVHPLIAYHSRLSSDQLEQSLQNLSELEHRMETWVHNIEKMEEEAREGLEAIRKSAGEAGILEQSKLFSRQARTHEVLSWMWLAASIVMVIVLGAFGCHVLKTPPPSKATSPQILYLLVGRFAIFSAILYGLVVCVRNLNAHRHNYVVNSYRMNALGTYPLLIEAIDKEDKETRMAVYLQATQAIFSHQPSGFLLKPSDSPDTSKIVEAILKKASSASKDSG